MLSVLLGRHPCSVHLSGPPTLSAALGERNAPRKQGSPCPSGTAVLSALPPHRGVWWLVLTRRMRGGRPAAAGGAAGPAGPAGSGPPQAGRAGPGRAGRSWGTGQGSPGAGKGRPVIAGSAVGEERGLCVGVGPQVCVRGSAAAGAGAGYGGVGAVSVPCRCRVCAEAEELSRPCWSPGLRQWGLIEAWSCRGVGVFCPGFPRGDGGGCWHLESLLPSVVAWGGRGAPGHPPAWSGEPRAGPSVPYRAHRGQRWWHWLPAAAGRGLLAGRSVLGDLRGLFSCVHRTLNAPRC